MASMADDYGRSRFRYDIANHLVSAVDARGHVVLNRYDAAGRRAALTLPDNSAYLYTYDTMSNLTGIESSVASSVFERDAARRLVNYQPLNANVEYQWSETHLERATSTLLNFTELYTPADPQMPGVAPLTADVTDYPLAGGGGEDAYVVRRDLRVASENHELNSTPEMAWSYDYDPAGNRSDKTDVVADPETFLQEYFNGANQLFGFQTVETQVDQPTIASPTNKVTTDKNGNITQLVQPLEGVDTFTWDFRYDFENRLIEARGYNTLTRESILYEFGYDGLGRRVWQQVNYGAGTWFVYDGDQLVQERNSRSDKLIVEYAWGPSTGVPAIYYQHRVGADAEDVFFFTAPQGGFPRYVFDTSDTVLDAFQYSAFGELVYHNDLDTPTQVDFGWQGSWRMGGEGTFGFVLEQSTNTVNLPQLGYIAASTLQDGEDDGSISIGEVLDPGFSLDLVPVDMGSGGLISLSQCCKGSLGAKHTNMGHTTPPGARQCETTLHPGVTPQDIIYDPNDSSNVCSQHLGSYVNLAKFGIIHLSGTGCLGKDTLLTKCMNSLSVTLGQQSPTGQYPSTRVICRYNCKDTKQLACTRVTSSNTADIIVCLNDKGNPHRAWSDFPPGPIWPVTESLIVHEALHVCSWHVGNKTGATYEDFEHVQACMVYNCTTDCRQEAAGLFWPERFFVGGTPVAPSHLDSCGLVKQACPRLRVGCGKAYCRIPKGYRRNLRTV